MNIFISYSHKDEMFKNEFLEHLAGIQRQGIVKSWDDRQIDGGSDWKNDIMTAINRCNAALLFISSSFIASEFIYSVELKSLFERYEKNEIRIIPIIIRPCTWQLEKFSKLQAWPKDGIPIIQFPHNNGERDAAWSWIITQIAKLADESKKLIKESDHSSLIPSNLNTFSTLKATISTKSIATTHISELSSNLKQSLLTRKINNRISIFPFCLNENYRTWSEPLKL